MFKRSILHFSVIAIMLLIPLETLAQNILPGADVAEGLLFAGEPFGYSSPDIRLVIVRLIRTALSFIGIILVILIIWGGFLWMTAGGNDEQTAKAKKTIINAIIGLIIILMANSIANFVIETLVGSSVSPSI